MESLIGEVLDKVEVAALSVHWMVIAGIAAVVIFKWDAIWKAIEPALPEAANRWLGNNPPPAPATSPVAPAATTLPLAATIPAPSPPAAPDPPPQQESTPKEFNDRAIVKQIEEAKLVIELNKKLGVDESANRAVHDHIQNLIKADMTDYIYPDRPVTAPQSVSPAKPAVAAANSKSEPLKQ